MHHVCTAKREQAPGHTQRQHHIRVGRDFHTQGDGDIYESVLGVDITTDWSDAKVEMSKDLTKLQASEEEFLGTYDEKHKSRVSAGSSGEGENPTSGIFQASGPEQ